MPIILNIWLKLRLGKVSVSINIRVSELKRKIVIIFRWKFSITDAFLLKHFPAFLWGRKIRSFITGLSIVWIVVELIWSCLSDQAWSLMRCNLQFHQCSVLNIINEVWWLLQWDNFDILPLQPFYPLRLPDDQDGCWLEACRLANIRESWWCQLWSLLIKSATMLSCWDLTWCPSYLQITLHIVHQTVLPAFYLTPVCSSFYSR